MPEEKKEKTWQEWFEATFTKVAEATEETFAAVAEVVSDAVKEAETNVKALLDNDFFTALENSEILSTLFTALNGEEEKDALKNRIKIYQDPTYIDPTCILLTVDQVLTTEGPGQSNIDEKLRKALNQVHDIKAEVDEEKHNTEGSFVTRTKKETGGNEYNITLQKNTHTISIPNKKTGELYIVSLTKGDNGTYEMTIQVASADGKTIKQGNTQDFNTMQELVKVENHTVNLIVNGKTINLFDQDISNTKFDDINTKLANINIELAKQEAEVGLAFGATDDEAEEAEVKRKVAQTEASQVEASQVEAARAEAESRTAQAESRAARAEEAEAQVAVAPARAASAEQAPAKAETGAPAATEATATAETGAATSQAKVQDQAPATATAETGASAPAAPEAPTAPEATTTVPDSAEAQVAATATKVQDQAPAATGALAEAEDSAAPEATTTVLDSAEAQVVTTKVQDQAPATAPAETGAIDGKLIWKAMNTPGSLSAKLGAIKEAGSACAHPSDETRPCKCDVCLINAKRDKQELAQKQGTVQIIQGQREARQSAITGVSEKKREGAEEVREQSAQNEKKIEARRKQELEEKQAAVKKSKEEEAKRKKQQEEEVLRKQQKARELREEEKKLEGERKAKEELIVQENQARVKQLKEAAEAQRKERQQVTEQPSSSTARPNAIPLITSVRRH